LRMRFLRWRKWEGKNGVKIRTGTLQARLDTVFSENKNYKSWLDVIALIICVSVFMICVTVQLLNIYMKRNELGIWLANGMTRKEVFEIIWLENFIKVVIGGIIGVLIEGLMVRLIYLGKDSVFQEISAMMYWEAPFWELGGICIFC